MKKIYNLTEGSILKKLLLVALPVLLTSIAQMAYNLTDMFWIGKVDSIGMDASSAIAAIGTSSYFPWLAFGLIMISKIGTSVKIGHSVGENKPHDIDVYASSGMSLQLILGVSLSVLILLFSKQFLGIFNIQDPLIVTYALSYIPIIGGFIIFQFLVNGFMSINEGLGQTKHNLIILAIGLGLNIALDPILILVFKWGITGAAIATVFAQGLTLILFYIFYKRNNPDIKIFKLKNLNIKAIKNILRIGFPVGVHSLLFTCISIYVATKVYLFGGDVVSAQRIGIQAEQLTWMIGSGFQTAITVFVGQNFGARQFKRIRKGMIYISLILIPYSVAVAALLFFNSEWLMIIFIDDPLVINPGIVYLQIISLTQIFMMLEAIGAGLFNGLGKSYVPSINGVVGNLLRIPLVLVLIKTMDELGIWWSINISSMFKGTVLVIASVIILFRLNKIEFKSLEMQKNKG
ncbi:MAG: MATE family efflux transporter [Tenericutes bacterium]|nr:MATE family efflux transporter [Mycoplasmatota bacterium]